MHLKIITDGQKSLYNKLHEVAEESPNLGRLMGIPVALLDVGLETSKKPINFICYVAMTIATAVASVFGKASIKTPLCNLQKAVCKLPETVVAVLLSPVKLFIQIVANVAHPQTANSIRYKHEHIYDIDEIEPCYGEGRQMLTPWDIIPSVEPRHHRPARNHRDYEDF